MGVKLTWKEDFLLHVQQLHTSAQLQEIRPYQIVQANPTVSVNLISSQNNFTPTELLAIQKTYADQGKLLVNLWEDVWANRKTQVLSRVKSFLNLNKGFHGRKTKVEVLTAAQTAKFLTLHHLQGYAKAKFNYGLLFEGELLAAASFSEKRPMKSKGADYQSAELVRYAAKDGITVVGGLSKLIKHFIKIVQPNDVMSYADRDWSLGKGYEKLGFSLSETTPPTAVYLSTATGMRYFPHRLPKDVLANYEAVKDGEVERFISSKGFEKLFNTGNLKYHLYC